MRSRCGSYARLAAVRGGGDVAGRRSSQVVPSPLPGIGQVVAAEQHHAFARRVVSDRGVEARRRRRRRMPLGPGRAVPHPGVTERAEVAEATEHHRLAAGRVVGHGVLAARGRTVDGARDPDAALVLPGVAEARVELQAAEHHGPVTAVVVGHRRVAAPGRLERILRDGPRAGEAEGLGAEVEVVVLAAEQQRRAGHLICDQHMPHAWRRGGGQRAPVAARPAPRVADRAARALAADHHQDPERVRVRQRCADHRRRHGGRRALHPGADTVPLPGVLREAADPAAEHRRHAAREVVGHRVVVARRWRDGQVVPLPVDAVVGPGFVRASAALELAAEQHRAHAHFVVREAVAGARAGRVGGDHLRPGGAVELPGLVGPRPVAQFAAEQHDALPARVERHGRIASRRR
jgi:hypothetical protein